MELTHRILAFASVAATGVGIVWSLLLAMGRLRGRRLFDRFGVGVVVLFALAALAGAARLASGARPNEDLHLVYSAIAIGLIPLARSFVAGTSRREAWLIVAAYLVLGAVAFRLFTTG